MYQSPDVYAAIDSAVPRTLDVVDFAAARSTELSALVGLLSSKDASDGGGRRVFQTLPRHLRRRAQSHNLHRLPYRLRAAAQREMEGGMTAASSSSPSSPTSSSSLPLTNHRRKRRRPTNALASHAHRQSRHAWLETHIWHAKRFDMLNAWGWRLAQTPTDKSWRAMHKASLHLCTLCDVSHISAVEVRGEEKQVAAMMADMTGGASAGGGVLNELYRGGQREGELLLHYPQRYPHGLIAPVKFHWRPPTVGAASAERALWLWVHAAVYEELLQLLSAVAAQHGCAVQSLRGELCRFELTGSRCQQVLGKVLKAVEDESSQVLGGEGSRVWRMLCDEAVRASSSLPSSAVLGVMVTHPATLKGKHRIQQPFTVTPHSSSSTAPPPPSSSLTADLLKVLTRWPSTACESPLWHRDARLQMTASTAWGQKKERFAQQSSDRAARAAAAAVEATTIPPATDASGHTAEVKTGGEGATKRGQKRKAPPSQPRSKPGPPLTDDLSTPIPLLLIQRPSPASPTSSSSIQTQRHQRGVLSGWDLILPAGLSLPFLHALHRAGARVEGMAERHARVVEGGGLSFPVDYPDCAAGWMWERWQGEEEKAKWMRTPPAKRVNWVRGGVHSPWWPDWDGVLGLERGERGGLGLDVTGMKKVDSAAKGWEGPRTSDRVLEVAPTPAELETKAGMDVEGGEGGVGGPTSAADVEGVGDGMEEEMEEANAELVEREQKASAEVDVAGTLPLVVASSSSSPAPVFVLPYYVLRRWRHLIPPFSAAAADTQSSRFSFLSSPSFASALLPVTLHPIHRGTLTHNALIALPNPAHLPSLLHSTPLPSPSPLDHLTKHNLYTGSDEPLHTVNEAPHSWQWNPCGFVTSGVWSYLSGEGEGVGLVTAAAVDGVERLSRGAGCGCGDGRVGVVMVRNVTSRTWRPMWMRLR